MYSQYNYHQINHDVMIDTKSQYENNADLKQMVANSIKAQVMVAQEDNIDQPLCVTSHTDYIVTGGRSLAEAQPWAAAGKKVAVLNFANNHSIGGKPFSAGAQEESICRCSTLFPCLEAMKDEFYLKHEALYNAGKINYMGNDDLIYTPDVCVFKTDEQTDPIIPKMLPRDKWYNVDIITCAAPEMKRVDRLPSNYEEQIGSRIKRILDVAKMHGAEVLILGAWGCGAFKNPEDIVARVFHEQLKHYDFEKVIFPLCRKDFENSPFAKEFNSADGTIKDMICKLLKSTGRENMDKVLSYLETRGFYDSPASVRHHNNFRGGLAKHSLEVYRAAMELNKEAKLPESSVIICSLLHDVCKIDQYVMQNGHPVRVDENCHKGHGRRSMFILKRGCSLPLNYDEEMAIWWHMGERKESKGRLLKERDNPANIELCKLIQRADGIAAHQESEI